MRNQSFGSLTTRIQNTTALRLVKNSGLLLSANLFSRIGSIILIGMMARQWGQTGVADYVLSMSWAGYTIFLADLGISVLAIRILATLPHSERPEMLGQMLILKLMILPMMLVAALIAWYILPYSKAVRTAIIIVGMGIAVNTFSQLFIGMYRSVERMEFETTLTVVTSVVWVVLGIAIILLGGNIVALAVGFLLVALFRLGVASFQTIKFFGPPTPKLPHSPRKKIREAMPFGITSVVARGYTETDIQILSLFVTASILGTYSAAARLVVFASLLPVFVSQAVFPLGARLWSQRRQEDFGTLFRALIKYQFAVSLVIAGSFIVLADQIIWIIYGSGFESSVPILRLLALVIPIKFISQALGSALETSSMQHVRSFVAVLGLGIALLLNIGLISRFGLVGAITAVIFSELAMVSLMIYFNRANLTWDKRYWISIAILLVVGLFVFVAGELFARTISDWHPWLYVVTVAGMMSLLSIVVFTASKQLPNPRQMQPAQGHSRDIAHSQ